LDLGIGLSWAPSRVREEAILSNGHKRSGVGGGGISAGMSSSTGRVRSRWRGGGADEDGRIGTGTQATGGVSDVAEAFREALGDAAYSTFKIYVHKFDAQSIPLDGPYGLISHARRLLDTANTLDERGKQALLEKFVRFVQENQS